MSQVVALLQFILVIHATKALYFGEIVQKLLAHDDAAGTYELSDVAARSQEGNIRSGNRENLDWFTAQIERRTISEYIKTSTKG